MKILDTDVPKDMLPQIAEVWPSGRTTLYAYPHTEAGKERLLADLDDVKAGIHPERWTDIFWSGRGYRTSPYWIGANIVAEIKRGAST